MTADAQDPRVRVLLVDDTPDVRLLVRMLFAEASGTEVVGEAADGEEAIRLAAALQPDLIVLDVAMPVLDGISALPALRTASPHSRVVMLSSLPHATHAAESLAAGAAAYVEKTRGTRALVDDILLGADLLGAAVAALSREARGTFPADLRSASAARRFAAEALGRWEQFDMADTITLLISELVANAVVHAAAAPEVTVRLLPDRVHVEVADSGEQIEGRAPGRVDDDATSGRGLGIVEELAMAWGSVRLPEGKLVWFDVAREPTPVA